MTDNNNLANKNEEIGNINNNNNNGNNNEEYEDDFTNTTEEIKEEEEEEEDEKEEEVWEGDEIILPCCRNFSEFEIINQIGEGTYGVVFRAIDKKTDEIVALKKIRMEAEREGIPVTSLREIQLLKQLKHPNIVNLKEVVTSNSPNQIYLVFEYIEHDLAHLIDTKKNPFSESHVKQLMIQLLKAVEYMHGNWVIHRDLKLANLLYSNKGELKVADFGLARLYGLPSKPLTPKVVTLWYRPPELLFGAKIYSTGLDMWAVGCIFGELLLQKPLLPGRTEIDQINQICNLLGSPNKNIWADFPNLPMAKEVSLPHQPYNNLSQKIACLSKSGLDLLNRCLSYDPNKRITASEALRHPYFKENPLPTSQGMLPTFRTVHDQMNTNNNNINNAKPKEQAKRTQDIKERFDRFNNSNMKRQKLE